MEKIIVEASNKTTGSEKYALFIGRWQPWHDGHQWLIDQQLNKGNNVCIAIRDVPLDEKNWWGASDIADNLVERFHNEITEGKIKVIVIPDIESINIGRGVGYDIIEHVPSDEIANISATKIREQLKQQQEDEKTDI
jgi:nicotinamide mononucleotide adenylyltransferase